jgi:octaprenyl-diphosphate synthase
VSRAGALIAHANPERVTALTDYGLHLGVGFQMIDDALDYMGQAECLGKPVGQDARQGKVTLPLLYVMQHGSAEAQQRIRHLFTHRPLSEAAVREVLGLVAQQQGVAATREKAHGYVAQAKACLSLFPDGAAKQSLLAIADLVATRAR